MQVLPSNRIRVMTGTELSAEVQGVIADCLGLDRGDVLANYTLVYLGAEDIDLLDMAYQLKQRFGFHDFTQSDIFPTMRDLRMWEGPDGSLDNTLSIAQVEQLRSQFPTNRALREIPVGQTATLDDLFTVEHVTQVVAQKLGIRLQQ